MRDLPGFARAIHRARRAARAPDLELERIEAAGREPAAVIDVAASARADTAGMRAAWARAEDGCRRLGDVMDAFTRAEPVVRAAQGAVLRRSTKPTVKVG